MRSGGCRPPHLTLNTTFPNCCNLAQLRNFKDIDSHQVACRQVEKILYSYQEYPTSFTKKAAKETVFQVLLNFQGVTYMEIEQVRAFDFQSLVGNAGGYVGVFLGVALLQLPRFLISVYNYIKQWFRRN